MARAFFIDDPSLVFRELDTTPSHRTPLSVNPSEMTSLPSSNK
jgi:hypothetical protein